MGCLGNSKTAEDQGVDEKERREANKKIEKQLQKERLAYKATHRLLLLGKGGGRAAAPGPSGAHSPERSERARGPGGQGRKGAARTAGDRATASHQDPLLQPRAGEYWEMSTPGRVIAVWVGRRDGNGIGLRITAIFVFVCRGW